MFGTAAMTERMNGVAGATLVGISGKGGGAAECGLCAATGGATRGALAGTSSRAGAPPPLALALAGKTWGITGTGSEQNLNLTEPKAFWT